MAKIQLISITRDEDGPGHYHKWAHMTRLEEKGIPIRVPDKT